MASNWFVQTSNPLI